MARATMPQQASSIPTSLQDKATGRLAAGDDPHADLVRPTIDIVGRGGSDTPLVLGGVEWRVSGDVVLEPVSTGTYELSYAFCLIPRFQNHLLKGDLAEDLYEMMKSLCVGHAWKLDLLSIKPEYLQWIVRSRANISSSNIVQIIRSKTSREIMANYPVIRQENPSHDFWAPGYMLAVGQELHPAEKVAGFIKLTRQQQTYRAPRMP
jgi:REP element-mobilizing transposase RayT